MRFMSTHQWGEARREGYKCDPPPESVFLNLARALKTDAHPSLVALGLGDRPPACVELPEDKNMIYDKKIPPGLCGSWITHQMMTINGYAQLMEIMDNVSASPRWCRRLCWRPSMASLSRPEVDASAPDVTYAASFATTGMQDHRLRGSTLLLGPNPCTKVRRRSVRHARRRRDAPTATLRGRLEVA